MFGGNVGRFLDHAETCNLLDNDTWTDLPNLPAPSGLVSAVVHMEAIFISTLSQSFIRFDPFSKTYVPLAMIQDFHAKKVLTMANSSHYLFSE